MATKLAQAMVNAATARSQGTRTTTENKSGEEGKMLADNDDQPEAMAATYKLSREAFQRLLIMCNLNLNSPKKMFISINNLYSKTHNSLKCPHLCMQK